MLFRSHTPSNVQPRPVTPGHDKAPAFNEKVDWQAMPEHDQEQQVATNSPFTKPDDQPRQTMVAPGNITRPNMTERGDAPTIERDHISSTVKIDSDHIEADKPRPGMVGGGEEKVDGSTKEKQAPENKERDALPDSADLVTVEEAVKIFAELGLPRHIRTIQKYCAKKKGRALTCYQIPTENGIRYMIDKSSIIRFIGDAAQQAPTGKIDELERIDNREVEHRQSSSAQVDLDVYEHPYVKRLESEVENEKERYASLQMRFETAMDISNQRLVELQQASAVAQSESLGRFLIETKRMEIEPGQNPAPVHKPPAGEGSVVQ